MKWPKRAISRYLTLVCGRQLLLVVGTQSWNLIFLPFLVKNIVAKSISGQILLKLPKYFLRCTMLLNHPKKCNQITWAAEDKKIIVTKYHRQNNENKKKQCNSVYICSGGPCGSFAWHRAQSWAQPIKRVTIHFYEIYYAWVCFQLKLNMGQNNELKDKIHILCI